MLDHVSLYLQAESKAFEMAGMVDGFYYQMTKAEIAVLIEAIYTRLIQK